MAPREFSGEDRRSVKVTSTEAGLILEIQRSNHQQNRDDIGELKADVKSVKGDVADIKSTLYQWQGAQSLSKWLIATSLVLAAIMLTALGILIANYKTIIHALAQ